MDIQKIETGMNVRVIKLDSSFPWPSEIPKLLLSLRKIGTMGYVTGPIEGASGAWWVRPHDRIAELPYAAGELKADATSHSDILKRRIAWPEQAPLEDAESWRHGSEIVNWLCELCDSVVWIEGIPGKDQYVRMPYSYKVKGVLVEFLPHWGYYEAGGMGFQLPATKQTLLQVICHVKGLQEHLLARKH